MSPEEMEHISKARINYSAVIVPKAAQEILRLDGKNATLRERAEKADLTCLMMRQAIENLIESARRAPGHMPPYVSVGVAEYSVLCDAKDACGDIGMKGDAALAALDDFIRRMPPEKSFNAFDDIRAEIKRLREGSGG